MSSNANWVAFGAGNTLGGGTVFIDGKGFFFTAGTTAANFEIGDAHGTMQNGSSGMGHVCERADDQYPHGLPQGLLGNPVHQ